MARNAFSTMEVTIALLLLTACAVSVGRFVFQVHQGLRDRELSSHLGWEIENAKETIQSWNRSQVSVEHIESMPMSDAIRQRLTDACWRAQVKPIQWPAAALEVNLRLECRLDGQLASPKRLTFWISDAETEAGHAE